MPVKAVLADGGLITLISVAPSPDMLDAGIPSNNISAGLISDSLLVSLL